jgi:hypothetical protein
MSNFNSSCETIKEYIACEVLREAAIKNSVFWHIRVRPCSRHCYLLHAGIFFGLVFDNEDGSDMYNDFHWTKLQYIPADTRLRLKDIIRNLFVFSCKPLFIT